MIVLAVIAASLLGAVALFVYINIRFSTAKDYDGTNDVPPIHK